MVALICLVLFYIGCCIAVSEKSRASLLSVATATGSLIGWCRDLFFDAPHYVVRGVVWCGVSWGSVSESVCVGTWRWITRAKLKEALYDAERDLYQLEMNLIKWKGLASDHQCNSESYEKRLRKAEHDLWCYKDKYNPNSIPSQRA